MNKLEKRRIEADKKLDKVNELIKKGMSAFEACEKLKINNSSYYYWTRRRATEKTVHVPKKVARVIDVVPPQHNSKVAIVVCDPNEISSVLAGLGV